MIERLLALNATINDVVWGPPFMILLVGTGVYLTIRLGCIQLTHFRYAWRQTFGRLRQASDAPGAISPFQAVSSAMAGTIGVGNIAGVATAIALGGPGAIFWMWAVALVGMATKLAEATLGVKYRHLHPDGRVAGGVFWYIEKGLGANWRWLGLLYAFFAGLAAFGIGNMVQANTVGAALRDGFNVPEWLTGIFVVVLVGLVTLGGIRRIAITAERIVPLMALLYLVGALGVLVVFIERIPAALALIFANAFTPAGAAGGFAGATVGAAIRYGIARGIFSNEAGLGSASIVHAQARNTPLAQGFWGMWEVFIDTIVVCTMTALAILVTGAYTEGLTGVALTSAAFSAGLSAVGRYVVIVGIALFSYSTMLTWNFYGEQSWEYLFGAKVVLPYRLLFLAFLFVGAIGGLEPVWDVADTLNGLMAAPNLIALLLLAGVVAREKATYFGEARLAVQRGESG